MQDLYIGEVHIQTIFLPLIIWVYLQSLLHSEPQKNLYMIRWCVTVVQDLQGHRNWY